MADGKKLFLLIVHGIGPQDDALLKRFRAVLKKATLAALRQVGRPELIDLLHVFAPVWAHVRDSESSTWLHTLFPDSCNPFKLVAAFVRLAWSVFLALLAAVIAVLLACWLLSDFASGSVACRLAGGLAAAVLGVILMALYFWRRKLGFIPWGDAYRLGRSFQANSLSDVVMYLSDGPRQGIFQGVLKAVLKDEEAQEVTDASQGDKRASVMLCGHSWGSVINFDVVLGVTGFRGSVEEGGNPVSSVRRRLELLADHGDAIKKRGTVRHAEVERLTKQIEFYKAVARLYERIEPVGMITMGSPIAFFLFRKPDILGSSVATQRRDLWKALWPQKEAGQDRRNGVRWRWQNFWHPADFVAHRLAPLYSQGFVDGNGEPRDFMTDVKVSQAVQGPIDAHSSYWRDPMVHRLIAEQLAEALVDLNAPPQSTTGSKTAEGRSVP